MRDTDTRLRGSTNMMSGREIGVNCKADRVINIPKKKSNLVSPICAILVNISAHGTNLLSPAVQDFERRDRPSVGRVEVLQGVRQGLSSGNLLIGSPFAFTN